MTRGFESRLEQSSILPVLDEGLGHELRNLVLPMLLRLDALVKSESLSSKAHADLQGIRQSILHLQRIANGLRLISVDPSAQESEEQHTRLHRWWKAIRTLVVDALPPHAFVHAEISAELPAAIIPPGVLAHVIMHILAEARSALQHVAMPKLVISATASASGIEIVVSDNGPSRISDGETTEAHACFENRTSDAGAALRLCVARSLVQRYGGTLRRINTGDEDSRLVISLPAAPDDESAGERQGRKRVRVALQDPRHQAFARLLLAQRGMFEVAADDAADFIICDAKRYCELNTRDQLSELAAQGATVLVIGRPNGESRDPKVRWLSTRDLSKLGDYLR